MRSLLIGVLVAAIALAPIPAYAHGGGGRGGGFAGGGGGGHMAASHAAVAHTPSFSHSAESFNRGGFAGGAGGFHESVAGGAGGFHGAVAGGPANFAHVGATNVNMHAGGFENMHPGGFENRGNFGGGYGNFAHNGAMYHNANLGYRPNYYGSWYHGSWGGHYGYPWGYRPGGWGYGWGFGLGAGLLTAGMIGMMASPYSWGYYNYSNPYYYGGSGVPAYANYSQPLMGAPPVYATQPMQPGGPGDIYGGPPAAPQDPALIAFNGARDAFMQGNYQGALAQVNQALTQSPNDSVMQEFRATCLFAMQDYQQSAAALYAVLSSGPGWDWTTMSGLYPNIDVYTGQLRALEGYRTQNPSVAYAHFLLAYQYMLLGYKEQAATELNSVVSLQPNDQLSAQLLRGLTTPANPGSAIAGQPGMPQQSGPAQQAAPSQPVDAAALVGNWQATRSDGSAFGLKLTPDNNFTWQFTQQGKQQVLNGSYTIANNYLILKASDQNTLLGQVAMVDPNHFTFKLTGDNPADPGLTFTR